MSRLGRVEAKSFQVCCKVLRTRALIATTTANLSDYVTVRAAHEDPQEPGLRREAYLLRSKARLTPHDADALYRAPCGAVPVCRDAVETKTRCRAGAAAVPAATGRPALQGRCARAGKWSWRCAPRAGGARGRRVKLRESKRREARGEAPGPQPDATLAGGLRP